MRGWVLLLIAPPLMAAEFPSWEEYKQAHRHSCPGPLDTTTAARSVNLGAKAYSHTGYRLRVISGEDADRAVTIGVVSAMKDVSPGTRDNLKQALKWFRREGVEWLVVNGDIGGPPPRDLPVREQREGPVRRPGSWPTGLRAA